MSAILKDQFLKNKPTPAKEGPSAAKDVQAAGGVVEAHSRAFQSMLSLRGSKGVTIRPAGHHSVGLLAAQHPAKPLWVKGKTIDLSKLNAPQLNTLRRYLKVANPPVIKAKDGQPDQEELVAVLRPVLSEGLIPSDQTLSKWLRDVEIGKKPEKELPDNIGPEEGAAAQSAAPPAKDKDDKEGAPDDAKSVLEDLPLGVVVNVVKAAGIFSSKPLASLGREAEIANAPIKEMKEASLIKNTGSGRTGDDQQYVAPPGEKAGAYTGDYDMYGISRAFQSGRARELQNLTTNARKAFGDDEGEAPKVDAEKAHRPMAESKSPGKPDGKHAHKLFGNMSPFEIGMMLDLNAAASAWGGYEGGQVIKHGAESGNFQYPQSINDGIVSVGPDHVNFDPTIKDEAKGVNFPLVFAKVASVKKGFDFPINSTLDWLYNCVKGMPAWNTAAADPNLFKGDTINMEAVKTKVYSDPGLLVVVDKVKKGIELKSTWIGKEKEAMAALTA